MRLIDEVVPRRDLAADYVVLAALLFYPVLAAPHIERLHEGDWTTQLHQYMARIVLSYLRHFGGVDYQQLSRILNDADFIRPEAFAVERKTLERVSNLLHHDSIVADAVAVVTGHRQGAMA
jgi:hypothetical protein